MHYTRFEQKLGKEFKMLQLLLWKKKKCAEKCNKDKSPSLDDFQSNVHIRISNGGQTKSR